MFCTTCHKIDVTTGYCSWVEIYPYKKKQKYASQTPDVQLYRYSTIIAESSVFMNGASKYGHHLLIAE